MSDRDDSLQRLDEAGRDRRDDDAGDVRRPDTHVGAPTSLDDERVLAFALGLVDDPELAAAAAADEALARRVEMLRAGTAAVAEALERVVPRPPDDYTDLGAERWRELRRLVRAPTPRRRPAWLRVLAPAAAVALVLVAGVVGLQRLSGQNAGRTSATDTSGKPAESYGAGDRAPESAAEGAQGAGGLAPVLGRGAPRAASYRTIVVARAGTSAHGRQTFAVVRVLKGQTDPVVILEVTGAAAPPGTLHVLYLVPDTDASPASTPELPPSGAGGRSPREGPGALRAFRFDGLPAFALQLPDDTDPATLTLP